MCGIAISRLHLSSSAFYTLTPIEFDSAVEDKNEQDFDTLTAHQKTIFESMRLQTLVLVNMNPYIKKKYHKPEEIIELIWDKEREKEKRGQTVDEMKNILLGIASTQNAKIKKNGDR